MLLNDSYSFYSVRLLLRKGCLLALVFAVAGSGVQAQKKARPALPVELAADGRLVYSADERGDRIPDFSYSGYKAGMVAIPDAAVKVVVPVTKEDATLRIQSALDYVAGLQPGSDGIRGAVLLEKGVYEVAGALRIGASGVILRGSGAETVVKGMGHDRQTLIRIAGKKDRVVKMAQAITDPYVAVNAMMVRVAKSGLFKAGDKVVIHRPSTAAWIQTLGTVTFGGGVSALGWKPGERDIIWDRTVAAVNGNTVTLDAPLTTALDTTYGGATIAVYDWPGRINQVGVENLSLESAFDNTNPKDEAHRWMAITLENAEDAWVRQIKFSHFAGSAVNVLETARRITVEDCMSFDPVSEIGGQRRYTFFTSGGQTLFQRLYSEAGYHDFAVGFCAPGPNVFVQCDASNANQFSGTIDSWASGVLFDIVNIDGNALRFGNRGQDGQGAGWSAANSVLWQCTAARIDCYKPPTAQNWAFGSWAQFAGDGFWDASNESINPRSLYYAQLADRLKANVNDRAQLLVNNTNASSSPSVEQATELTAWSAKPQLTMKEWIPQMMRQHTIPVAAGGVKTIDQIGIKKPAAKTYAATLQVNNSWVVRGAALLTGSRLSVPWWTGGVLAPDLLKAKPAITRFVPGRTGAGLTDDLEELTDSMVANNQAGMEQNYGLWYERRRDDHERIRRMDGEVWPPFYELPFARSGKELAWDGLSKYDLTKYNTWYFDRLEQYADLADQKGLLLVNQHYFQHNIIEAGAHYADFPWRSANNINHTGFPEPVPYAGDKRLFLAEQFYDISVPARRELHRAYIRQCLNNFVSNNGVIHLIGEEFTGPLHFVQFWLDVVAEWEKETGKHALVGLATTKDVQDAILADPVRSKVIDIIDIRYWHYQTNGKLYAPEGGKNLAPRQWARILRPKGASAETVYRAVSEYRRAYSGKAVMYSGDNAYGNGWAVFMAGGSLANVPAINKAFLADAATTSPVVKEEGRGIYLLANPGKTYIFYSESGDVDLDLTGVNGKFRVRWINPSDGAVLKEEQKVQGGKAIPLKSPRKGTVVAWVTKL
ncbi:DUF6298 domain-containing protein [Filimonas effusa]|uniref:Pectate lyase n=1 Tax=Filimonas effusa TaxID=2508721 RepID=A0A4Q1DDI4_9BACT|nr:DUF6298 domain-containing protein [Filimonas effusa]RXK86723.1 pectate lyase [Filimonas effusa]